MRLEKGLSRQKTNFFSLVKLERNNMHQIYTEIVNLEMENLPPFIEQGVIEYFPHVGHCLCLRSWLPNDNAAPTPKDFNLPGLELKVRFLIHSDL